MKHSPHALPLVGVIFIALKLREAGIVSIEEQRYHTTPPGGSYDTFLGGVTVHIGVGHFTLRRNAKGIAVCRYPHTTKPYDPVLPWDATLLDVLAVFDAVATQKAA
jgi:hypothetical protein